MKATRYTNERIIGLLREAEASSMVRSLAVLLCFFVSGCANVSQPPRPFSAEAIEESGGTAYLWSVGQAKGAFFSLPNFAFVTRIDDMAIPSEYFPAEKPPGFAWRIEIPAGRHVIEILNKECSWTYFLPSLVPISNCTTVVKSLHSVEFTAVPGRAYTPIVDEKCGQQWFWIVDSGQTDPAGAQKMFVSPFIENVPAVAGVKPPEGPCPAPATDSR